MSGSLEFLVENEVVPALHRIAVAIEDLNDPKKGRDSLASIADSLLKLANPIIKMISEEEKEWTRVHGEPKPEKKTK